MMDIHTATELAYKNGYAKGYADGKGEWISVNERLPTQPGAYLVFTCDRRISMCHFIDHYCDGNMQFDDYRVTHWMPLPEPPMMKGGAELKIKKHILSFSGGKDSTFLLLELIRRRCPLDEVVFFDTGWEFPVMYEHIEKCKTLCKERGIKFVTLRPPYSFDELFKKYSWCGGNCRWGTTYKTMALDKYFTENGGAVQYIGIAADETARLEKERAEHKRFPLAEWGITEAECLRGCYAAGFTWGGMYIYLDRLSCKFCKNKNLRELRNIRKLYPEVWNELKDYQSRTDRPYKGEGKSVFNLEKRFAFEEERQAQGLSISNREFYTELKKKYTEDKT